MFQTDAKSYLSEKNIFGVRCTLISNWTSCRTIQAAIVLIISNRRRASRSSDFEITRVICTWAKSKRPHIKG